MEIQYSQFAYWTCNIVLLVSGIFILLNWIGLIEAMLAKKNCSFAPPFLCGIWGAIAAYLHPNENIETYFFVPLALDPSIGFFVLSVLTQHISHRLKKSKTIGISIDETEK